MPSFGLVSDGSRVAFWLENADGTELHVLELGSVSLDEARHPHLRSGSTNAIPQLQDEAILESVLLR